MKVSHKSIDFEGRLPAWFKVSFGLVGFADGMMVTAFLQFLMIFMTDTVRVDPVLVGSALMLGRLWDAVTDPLMGAISDRTRTRFGRRRPWLLWGCVPLALTWVSVWCIPANKGLLTSLHLFASIALFQTARTVTQVPYLALSAELSTDYHERSSIQAYRSALDICGRMLGAGFIAFAGMFENARYGFVVVAAAYGIANVILHLFTFYGIRENPALQQRKSPLLLNSFSYVFKNGPYIVLCLYFALTIIAFTFTKTFFVYIITYWLNKPASWVTALIITSECAGLAWLPVWMKVSRMVGKKRGNVTAIALGGILQASAFLLIRRSMPWLAFVWAALIGTLTAATQLFPFSLAAETVDLDELNTGHRKEGVYYGVIMFLMKLASAVGVAWVGYLLKLSGYVPEQEQTAEVILRLRYFHAIVPGAILVLACLLFGLFFKLDTQRALEIRRQLNARNDRQEEA